MPVPLTIVHVPVQRSRPWGKAWSPILGRFKLPKPLTCWTP